MTIIITVPHAKHPTAAGASPRSYDTAAARVATTIAQLATRGTVEVLYGDINRLEVDLNRREARETADFRKKLRERIAVGDVSFVLDVHSYPPENTEWANANLVILQDRSQQGLQTEATARSLYSRLTKLLAILLREGVDNDIQDELAELQTPMPCFGVEFNEGNADRVERILAASIAAWLMGINKPVPALQMKLDEQQQLAKKKRQETKGFCC